MPRCQMCRARGPTTNVSFNQNIGVLVVRFMRTVEGDLCYPCVHAYYWRFTAVTLLLGWWGIISFFITPFILLFNTIVYGVSLIHMYAGNRTAKEE
jgi:hypothetical protein